MSIYDRHGLLPRKLPCIWLFTWWPSSEQTNSPSHNLSKHLSTNERLSIVFYQDSFRLDQNCHAELFLLSCLSVVWIKRFCHPKRMEPMVLSLPKFPCIGRALDFRYGRKDVKRSKPMRREEKADLEVYKYLTFLRTVKTYFQDQHYSKIHFDSIRLLPATIQTQILSYI